MSGQFFQSQPFGKYLLTERIGAGGMAEIFRATAFGVEGFTKEICIKRILPTLTADDIFIRMFVSEAKIAVTLHHANIVQVFDLGRIGEHYFIAMELVRGRDLLEIINRCRSNRRRMPVPVALYILAQVCKGLEYAHRVKQESRPIGIIHRDVSPSNILVSWEGDVKVADFGIAKAAHKDEKTATGTLKGKYGYMSPEQVCGDPVDHRSDIFAAGILLYESLVAKRLFKGETDLDTLEKVRSARVSALPSAENKKVTPEVDRIVMKALALDPADRYQTAGELHDALADQLYTTGKRMDSKALSKFMHQLFSKEIQEEEEKEKERSNPDIPIFQQEAFYGPPTPTPAAPLTRPDLPAGLTPHPVRRPMSSLAIGALATLIILLVAGGVVGVYWYLNRPEPTPRANAGPAEPPAPRLGTLSISSQPHGADISINDQPSKLKTPALVHELDRSKVHTVKLTLKDHKPWLKKVQFGNMEMVALDAAQTPASTTPPEIRNLEHQRRTGLGLREHQRKAPAQAHANLQSEAQTRHLRDPPGEPQAQACQDQESYNKERQVGRSGRQDEIATGRRRL